MSAPIRNSDRLIRYEPYSNALAIAWPLMDDGERERTLEYYSCNPRARIAVYRQVEPAPSLTSTLRASLEANGWDLERRH